MPASEAEGEPSHTVLVSTLANQIQPILRDDLGDSILARPYSCEWQPVPRHPGPGRAADLLTLTTPAGASVTIAPLALATLVLIPTTWWATVRADIINLLAQHNLPDIDVERADESPQRTTGAKYRHMIRWPNSADLLGGLT